MKTRSKALGIKPVDKQQQNLGKKTKNKIEIKSIGASKMQSKNMEKYQQFNADLLKLCRPFTINLTRCVMISDTSSKTVFFGRKS